MTRNQKIAIVTPIILVVVDVPIFRLTASLFGNLLGWYFGLIIYWLIWGGVFSFWIIGWKNIRDLIHPQRLNLMIALLVIFPLVMASLSKLFTGMEYQHKSIWVFLLYLSTNFGNGFFEEVLWRGVYMQLFPKNIFFRIVWPSVFFALSHYAPGTVSANSNAFALIIGALFFGFYLSFIAKKTNTIWWCIVAHVLGGFVMIL